MRHRLHRILIFAGRVDVTRRAVSIIFYPPAVEAGARESTVKIEASPPNDLAPMRISAFNAVLGLVTVIGKDSRGIKGS